NTELMALIRHKKIPFELKIGDVRLNLSVLGKIPKTRGSAKAPKSSIMRREIQWHELQTCASLENFSSLFSKTKRDISLFISEHHC
ncbi:hypothetical protein NC796_21255, partial [Aliifodinibius sp. S!AR15-10]|uniref:hypothetical protein n=1 Tax=Aliifodinibius sp. S!AR15-10 TaxID=2950437 RepID=UPI002867A735